MLALNRKLFTAVYQRVLYLNGEDTEEDLSMEIAENIINKNINSNPASKLVSSVYASEPDTGDLLQDGVFVYNYKNLSDWQFEEFDTIADAVRCAVNMIGAMIIYNGNNISYSTLNDKQAYYVDENDKKVKIVDL